MSLTTHACPHAISLFCPPPFLAAQNVFGCDVSHRGGPPGFIQVEYQLDPAGAGSGSGTGSGAGSGTGSASGSLSSLSLRWPDYVGNNMFQTLGEVTRCLEQ